jgi:hypothetical protein
MATPTDPYTTARHAIDSPVGYSILDELGRRPGFPAGDVSHMSWRLDSPTLGILELDCEAGYVVTQFDLGWPDVRRVEYDRPLAHGIYDVTRFFGARSCTLSITLDGERAGVAEAMLRSRLARFMNPSVRSVLSFVEEDWHRRRRVVVRGSNLKAQTTSRFHNKMIASFSAPGSFIESYETECEVIDITPVTGSTRIVAVHNDGDVPAEWICEISGIHLDQSGGGLGAGVELMMNDRRLAFRLTLDTDDKLIISSNEKSAVVQSASGSRYSAYQYMTHDSEWWEVPPGVGEFSFKALNLDGDAVDLASDATIGEWTSLVGRPQATYFNVDGTPKIPLPAQAGEALLTPTTPADAAVWQPPGGKVAADPMNPVPPGDNRIVWGLPHEHQIIALYKWNATTGAWDRTAGYTARNAVRAPHTAEGLDGDHWWNHDDHKLWIKAAGVWTVQPLLEMQFRANGEFDDGGAAGEIRADLRGLVPPSDPDATSGNAIAKLCFHHTWTA